MDSVDLAMEAEAGDFKGTFMREHELTCLTVTWQQGLGVWISQLRDVITVVSQIFRVDFSCSDITGSFRHTGF